MHKLSLLLLFMALLNGCQDQQQLNQELLSAAEHNDLPRADEILLQGGDANAHDLCAITPLMRTSMNGNTDMVRRLLAAGAGLNLADKSGYSALMQAAGNNHLEVVTLLLEHGADINQAESDRGWTPLIWAAKRGHSEMVALLLENGADRSIKDIQLLDALAWAIKEEHKETASVLQISP